MEQAVMWVNNTKLKNADHMTEYFVFKVCMPVGLKLGRK